MRRIGKYVSDFAKKCTFEATTIAKKIKDTPTENRPFWSSIEMMNI